MLRPPHYEAPRSRKGRRGRKRPRFLTAFVLGGLVAIAGTALGLMIGDVLSDDGPAPMRLATPEEVAALTGAAATDATEELNAQSPSADGAPASGLAESGDLQPAAPATVPTAPDETPAGAATATPQASLGAAPATVNEPVVAVAATVSPSVVLVTVESPEGLEGLGSGIIWDADSGYIVTNTHVVEDTDSVGVTLYDGTQLEAEVIGGSSGHDVAVVRVDPQAAELAEAAFAPASSVRVGQLAVAIGSPLGLTGTVTSGIVSAVRIQVQGGADPSSPVPVEMIQTDAAINQGNSGGALADWQGRVIGMNTLIQTTSGGSIGLGFAVPSDTVELIATRIVQGESLELGYLGISGEPGGGDDLGVVIAEVLVGSPAEEAGLETGDVIISVDDEPMHDIAELSAAIKLRRPGETVELTVRRGGDLYIATAVLDPLG